MVFTCTPRGGPDHPRLPMSAKRRFMSYTGLRTTEPKMRRLFDDLPMTTFGALLDAGTDDLTCCRTFGPRRCVHEAPCRPVPLHRTGALLPGGVERLVRDHDVDVHIVRWLVKHGGPFNWTSAERVHVHERGAYNDRELVRLCAGLARGGLRQRVGGQGLPEGLSRTARTRRAHGDVRRQRHCLARRP